MTQNKFFNVPSASKQNCLSSQKKTTTEDFVHGQVLILANGIERTWQGSQNFLAHFYLMRLPFR